MLKVRGFTLIEIMIAVAIIAILAAIGYPNYADYVRRGRITEAISTLSNARVQMEQWFQDNRDYSAFACTSPTIPSSTTFDFDCPTKTATTYIIRATGKGSMTGFRYTIDQSNGRATTSVPAGWQGINNPCWVLKKDGSC